jgi:hypothetical protein
MVGRRSFIAALWMAIVVALLSAVAPLGPPSSRLTGSAFNPASVSVVLKARSPLTVEKALSVEAGPDPVRYNAAQVQHWFTAAEFILVAVTVLGMAPRRYSPGMVHFAPGHFSPRRARAPPMSF